MSRNQLERRLRRSRCSPPSLAALGRAGGRPGGRGDAVEPERVERADGRPRARRRRQSVPHLAMVHGAVYDAVNAIDGGHEGYLLTSRVAHAVRLEGRGGGDGGVPRAARTSCPAQQADARRAVRGVAGGDPGRLGEDARDRRRRGRSGGDDRGPDRRRPLRRRTGSRSGPGRACGGRCCRRSSTTRTRG